MEPLRIVISGTPGTWTPDQKGIRENALRIATLLIAEFEGFRSNAYRDPVGVWTIGYGHTAGVKQGDTITEDEADELLIEEARGFMEGVTGQVDVDLNDNQIAALTSFAYNLGLGAFANSTLLRKLNAGDYAGAQAQFQRWVYAGGKPLKGLRRRRDREADLFGTPSQ